MIATLVGCWNSTMDEAEYKARVSKGAAYADRLVAPAEPPKPAASPRVLRAAAALREAIDLFPCQDTWEKRRALRDTADVFRVSARSIIDAMPRQGHTEADILRIAALAPPSTFERTADPTLSDEQCAQIDVARLELQTIARRGGVLEDFDPPPVAGWDTGCQWQMAQVGQ